MAKKNKKSALKKNAAPIISAPEEVIATQSVDLQQLGVVITRPADQSEFLVTQITEHHGHALNVPCLVILEPHDTNAAIEGCTQSAKTADYWAFTSPNAVDYAVRFGLDFSLNIPCISIGAGTTKRLEALTSAPIIQGDAPYTSEKLLEKLSTFDLGGKAINIYSGEGGRRLLANAMTAMGAIAQYVDVYRRDRPEHIDLTAVMDYANNHPVTILVSSQEAFGAYHDAAFSVDAHRTDRPLIVASERLADYVQTLGYTHIITAPSAVSQDMWQALVEAAPHLLLSTFDSTPEDSSMTEPNDKETTQLPEPELNVANTVDAVKEEQPEVTPQPTEKPAPSTHNAAPQSSGGKSLSLLALALGVVGIGVGAFAFLQVSDESTRTQELNRTIVQQKTELETLSNALTNLQKTVATERGQSSNFTDLSDAQKQQQQNLLALQQRVGTLDSAINNLQADSGTASNRYNQLKDHIQQFESVVSNLDQSITQIGKMANDAQSDAVKTQNRLTSQLVEINSKIAALNTLEEHLSAKTDIDLLNLSQAQYLLNLANFKLTFEEDTTAAVNILKEASERLMATANAKFSETNNLIQSEIVKLQEIPTINRAEYATRIQHLIDAVPGIDTKSDDILGELKNSFKAEVDKDAANDDPNAKPWYSKAVDKIKPVFIVTQERTAAPELMSITDEVLLKQNMQMQLTTARLALLQHQAVTYQESLKAARTLLTNYFSPNDETYHQVLAALNELLNVNVAHDNLNIDPILKSFDASMLNYRGEGL
ncbi:uroporphyrinogen-III C-methyltransferase [Wohlfahrtiimonas chitiniclastica]|uniref:uroporphyrinogen-III C-methyltransferase n=1 Tax=Wohlfahrtiimonas chitiniclastica TaxID=400946 RepID=UPI0007B3FF31|nr:uroporphyrinogen-III C-methyltransferase [Wohlfahrtiimonas chitiniclastica]KZS22380.1 hypothetical protein BMY_0200 [Wohlfahrtiimonas chitiniclastica]MDC7251500.1 fused uroporphyrinogen-III synthase HemD/membrane protein HemX [Wohlfahrtiimonas chitiniclastica]WHR54879.1 uroporphyrinogen-III C-methyltransferase [Wohlfahrtiimonas chitiniclastica]